MYKDTDRYAFPDKWMEQDFEKLQILVEKAQKEIKRRKQDDRRKRSKSSN